MRRIPVRFDGRLRWGTAAALLVAASTVAGVAAASSASTTGTISPAPSVYSAIQPQGLPSRTLAANGATSFAVAGGTTGIPADATSVVLQVTTSATDTDGSLEVYPAKDASGADPVLTWTAGATETARLIVAVGASGRVALENLGSGHVNVRARLLGYYAPVAAPAPRPVSVDSENNSTPAIANLSGVGVQITAECGDVGGGNDATFQLTGTGPFSVSGNYESTGVVSVTPTSGLVAAVNGSAIRDDNGQSGMFEIDTSSTAQLSANLLVTSGGSVASVQVFLAGSTTSHCEARAVGVPTS